MWALAAHRTLAPWVWHVMRYAARKQDDITVLAAWAHRFLPGYS